MYVRLSAVDGMKCCIMEESNESARFNGMFVGLAAMLEKKINSRLVNGFAKDWYWDDV